MAQDAYIHGTHPEEQGRLQAFNRLQNEAFVASLELKRGERVLEVGSGLGLLARSRRCRTSWAGMRALARSSIG